MPTSTTLDPFNLPDALHAKQDPKLIGADRTHFRRIADTLEREEAVRIQVLEHRFTIPADAEMSIEHEVEGDQEELELQLRWRRR